MRSAILGLITQSVHAHQVTQEIHILNVQTVSTCILCTQHTTLYNDLCLTVPQISIVPRPAECYKNDDCPNDRSCINERCVNPCAARDACARGAFCHVNRHQPICTCPPSFVGNPAIECVPRKYSMIYNVDYH